MSDPMASFTRDSEDQRTGLVAFVESAAEANILHDYLNRLKRMPATVEPGGIVAARAWCELNLPPHILIVDLDGERWPLPALTALLALCGPTCQVIVTGSSQDVSLYRTLLQLGVTDYLVKPYTLDLLSATLAKCAGQQAGPEYARMGRTVAVAGASGGCGVSTLVMAIGRILAAERHLPVALVDYDRRNGCQLLLSGQPEEGGLAAVLASEELDTRLLQRAMVAVAPRLHLLAQKPDLALATAVEVDTVLNLGASLCQMFNQVVWDLPSYFPPAALDVLRYADLRILATELTLQDARNVRRILQEIGDESEGQRLLLVHNQSHFSGPPPLDRAQFEQFVGHAIDLVLPHGGTALAHSLSLGALNITAAPAFQQGVRQLVDLACGVQPQTVKKRWFAGLLRRA